MKRILQRKTKRCSTIINHNTSFEIIKPVEFIVESGKVNHISPNNNSPHNFSIFFFNISFLIFCDVRNLYDINIWCYITSIAARCKLGYEEQNEWYFFSHKDRKYPTGTRTNRATAAGFWKATGRDKAVLSKNSVIGMRKTLVYYKGRAPNGRKSDWIMHEYRLQNSELAPVQVHMSRLIDTGSY